jgi:xanthine dehydrogenase accessory factor
MVDILKDFEEWLDQGSSFALATVIKTWRSAPRSEGAAMMVSRDGTMIGSVSGGCVESAVVKEAQQLLNGGQSKRLSFGVSDEDAWSVGLSCGGQIDVWLEVVSDSPLWRKLIALIQSNEGCVLITGLEKKEEKKALYTYHQIEGEQGDENLLNTSRIAYQQHKTQIAGGYFLNVFPAKNRLIIIGAAHVSLDLIRLAHMHHFETLVIDPRGIFTNENRFNIKPDQIFKEWPAEVLPTLRLDADTYVVVLTHDPKIDDQALQIVLNSEAAYIGALGSRKTHAKRTARLKEAGLSEEQVDRIHGPVGVNINARQPSEIALSIMAQIIEVKNKFL